MDDLEIAMTALSTLPARVGSLETQVLHLRDEMRAGFSAMRGEMDGHRRELPAGLDGLRVELRDEMAGLRNELRGEMEDLRDELRSEMTGLRHELRGEMEGLRSDLRGEMEECRRDLRAEFRTGPDRLATWSETRAMYEDLIDRIKLLGEGIRAAMTGASAERPVPAPAPVSATTRARGGLPARRQPPRKKR